MYDTVVIGAGPAGLTSALYLARANQQVLVLEQKSYGGQIINANKIENYPGIDSISGFDFATNLYNQVKNLNVEIKYETVLRVDENKRVITNRNEYQARTVIIATGATNRKLGLETEEKLVGRGISYCATCDGNFYRNKVVAVIGGGNTALEDALYLSNLASKVYLIHRREEFRGNEQTLEELKKKDNVELLLNAIVLSLKGEDKLEAIMIKQIDKIENISIDGLFVAIGQEPKNEIFQNVVDLDESGYIITHEEVLTKTKGIYAIGDARVKEIRQLTTATGDGTIAAMIALKDMMEK